MGTLGVVEADPLADDTLGVEAIGELVQIVQIGYSPDSFRFWPGSV